MTGGAGAALIGFLAFYVTCVLATWFFYTRKNTPTPPAEPEERTTSCLYSWTASTS